MYYVLKSKELTACGSAASSIIGSLLRTSPNSEGLRRIVNDIEDLVPALKDVEAAFMSEESTEESDKEILEDLNDKFGYYDGFTEVSFAKSGSGLNVEMIVEIDSEKLIRVCQIVAEEGEIISRILASLYSVTMTLVHSFSRLNARLKKELT